MIHLDYPNKNDVAELHAAKIIEVVRNEPSALQDSLYMGVRKLMPSFPDERPEKDYTWLRDFILADSDTLESWVISKKSDLSFTEYFLDMYAKKFAKSPDIFIDKANQYNAYVLLKMMDFKVCPYCDDELLEIFSSYRGNNENNEAIVKERRTSDIDHFYPKKGAEGCPALAMCFYNLVPSGKGCNQSMNTAPIAANPHKAVIEDWSRFEPDIPAARTLESLTDDEIRIKLVTCNGMELNNKVLGLEERYNHHHTVIRRFLELKRSSTESNKGEKENLGIPREVIQQILGPSYPNLRGKEIHQKLRNDILGV